MHQELTATIKAGIRAAFDARKIPAFSYDRVSSEKQEEGLSLVHQGDSAARYAQERGLYLVHAFSITESAWQEWKKKERKTFKLMIRLAQEHQVKNIIFKNSDRFARNYTDLVLLEKLIDTEDFRIHFYQSRRIIDKTSTPNDRMILGVEMSMNKYWSDKISYECRETNKFKARSGVAPGPSPIGYVYDRTAKRHVIDKNAEIMLRFIFDEFDTGKYTVPQLAEVLNAKGYTTKNKHPWRPNKLHELLTRPFYHGEFIYLDALYKGTQDVYYDKRRYEKRMKRLHERFAHRSEQKHQFLLAGLVRCAHCGLAGTGDLKKGKYTYYIHKCAMEGKQISVPEAVLFDMLDSEMRKIQVSKAFTEDLKAIFQDLASMKRENVEPEISAMRSKQRALEKRIKKLYGLIGEDGLDSNRIQEQIVTCQKQARELEDQCAGLSDTQENAVKAIGTILDQIRDFPGAFLRANMEGKAAIAKDHIDRIIIDGKAATIAWKKPYSFLIKPEFVELAERVRTNPAMGLPRDEVRTLFEHYLQYALFEVKIWLNAA